MSFKLYSCVLSSALALAAVVACGSSNNSFDDGDAGASSGGPGSSSSGTDPGSSSSGSLSSDSGGVVAPDSGPVDNKCAAETQAGKQLPVDLLIMLDASGSMMEQTGASGTGPTKWASVKGALTSFIGDAASAGIGVGLQIFPIEHPGGPSPTATCSSNADCTIGVTSYGRCFLKSCVPATADDPLISCDTSADCPNSAPCEALGECLEGPFDFGGCLVGDNTYGCGGLGTCTADTASSCDGTECFVSDYSVASVGIAALPGNAAALDAKLNSLPDPSPNSLTPTSMALQGGLAIAKQYALANPTHVVVMVLATDGLPTRCAPLDIPSLSGIASTAVTGTPSIKTFVIGVFADDEKATGTANLNAIATGGGSGSAIVISSSGNVTAQFQAALNQIRGQALPCQYAVPVPEAGTPDYSKVNVQYTSATGATPATLPYKANAGKCDAGGGWYYDIDPTAGGVPTTINLCPTTCDGMKNSTSGTAKIDVVLGCQTVVK